MELSSYRSIIQSATVPQRFRSGFSDHVEQALAAKKERRKRAHGNGGGGGGGGGGVENGGQDDVGSLMLFSTFFMVFLLSKTGKDSRIAS